MPPTIDRILRLEAKIAELEAALKEIAFSKYCEYDNVATGGETPYRRGYAIGLADGHRFCAKIARTALSEPSGKD
jgi:hypothetical protein